jgi:hypothetical protein
LQKFQTHTGYSLEELDIYFTNNNHTTRQIIERYKKGLKLIAQQLDPEGNLLREEEENYTKAVSEKAVEKLEDLAKLQEAVKKLEEILQSFMKEVAEKFAKDWTEKSYEGQEGSARLAIYKENCDNLRNKLQKLIGKSDSHSSRDDTKERDSSSTKNSELETEKNGPQSKVTEAGKNNENLRKTNQQLKLATGICGLVAVISIGINFVRKSKPAEPRRIRRTAVEN